MVVFKPTTGEGHGVTVWLRPNRALSHGALKRITWALAAVVVATGMIGARQGNVFAPAFALIVAAGTAWALSVAWRGGNRAERITVDRRSLDVEVLPGHLRAHFQSGWVRVLLKPGCSRQRLLLASHGRAVEIGAFLADEERGEVWRKLRQLLAQATAPQFQPADKRPEDKV